MTSQKPQKEDFVMKPSNSKGVLDEFVLVKELGRGYNAKVYQGVSTKTGKTYAIKKIKNAGSAHAGAIVNETRLMSTLSHPNITVVHGLKEGTLVKPVSSKSAPGCAKPAIYSIMDFESGGEMFHFLKAIGRLPESVTRYYFRELLTAVCYCHEMGISHRDIKPENILFSDDFHLKLVDFGFAIGPKGEDGRGFCHSVLGSLSYMAPEIFSRFYKGPSADAFACGVVLFLMHTGKFPHRVANASDKHYGLFLKGQVSKFWKVNAAKFPAGHFSSEFMDLVSRLLNPDPVQRLTVQKALKHPWVCKPNLWSHENISQFMGKFTAKARLEQLIKTIKTPGEPEAKNSNKAPVGERRGSDIGDHSIKEFDTHVNKKTHVN